MYKDPKNDAKYHWTNHVKDKMRYYRISESLVKRVVRFPKRIEIGIAPNTIAVMQPRISVSINRGQKRTKKEEIWVMYQESTKPKTKHDLLAIKKKIITAWRYPGISPIRDQIPIPEDILSELNQLTEEV